MKTDLFVLLLDWPSPITTDEPLFCCPVQPLTPRQMRLVAGPADVCNQGGQSILREEEAPYAFDSKDARRDQRERLQRYLSLMKEESLDGTGAGTAPAWQSTIVKGTPERCATADNSNIIDSSFAEGEMAGGALPALLVPRLQARWLIHPAALLACCRC